VTIRSDPWKFQSTWRSEDWFNNTTIAGFLASSGYLYISDVVLGGNTTYFSLTPNAVQLWDSGVLIETWGTLTTSSPTGLEGVPMGLLLGITYAS